MTFRFYNRFIKPTSTNTDQAEREIVLNYLLVGMFILSVVTFGITLLGSVVSGGPSHPERLIVNLLTTLFIISLYLVARYNKKHQAVAVILTLLITLFGAFIAKQWGMLDPVAVLMFSLAVVMAGILIGARYSLYVTCVFVVLMVYLQHGESTGALKPDLSWLGGKPIVGDVISFSTILFLIALVSWLFNRQMELSLRRARHSEQALQRQKDLLEEKVEKRAQELEAAQLEKMQELYRFAELGRLSTALFHDLANHLSTVSLDIEGLNAKDQSAIMKRISQNVGHIDTIVKRVREQIRGKRTVEVFNVLDEIDEVMKILAPTAEQAKVTMALERDTSVRPSLSYKGDSIRFRQIILNLICNGIEAYASTSREPRTVVLRVSRQGRTLLIEVADHGAGIDPKDQAKIFRPFYTTKDKGVGIGLFIVQQVVENDFSGSIELLSNTRQGTIVSVTLPKSYYAQTPRKR